MTVGAWDKRYLAGTRGQLLALLRRTPRTIDDMAQELDLTSNAVRAHITVLERDGLVEQEGSRRTAGARKPSLLYRLTVDAERMFPKAHEALVPYLLELLAKRDPAAGNEMLIEIGRRMAAERSNGRGGDMSGRLEQALAALRELGGLPEAEANEDGYMICGYSCPFAPVVRTHPELCFVAQGMLSEVLGTPVEESCARGEEGTPVWCRFEVHPDSPVPSTGPGGSAE